MNAMLKIIPVAAFTLLMFAFNAPAKDRFQRVYSLRGDTTIPVAPQRVYLISPHETTSIMAASLHDARELKIEDSKEGYRIVRFRVTITTANGDTFTHLNLGSHFEPQLIYFFRTLAPKAFITFEDIELLSRTGQRNKAYPKIINTN